MMKFDKNIRNTVASEQIEIAPTMPKMLGSQELILPPDAKKLY